MRAFLSCAVVSLLVCMSVSAQESLSSFRERQFASDRVQTAWSKHNGNLRLAFSAAKLAWPPKDIYIRAFKSQNQLELWGRDKCSEPYRKVKTFSICAVTGKLGPKRRRGDGQIPEGFYFIEEFNSKSEYYLSLLLNYPNFADSYHGGGNPGGSIYIHGGCLTVGCLPMNDEGVSELYTACLSAKLNGQEYIPVHIYPTRLNGRGVSFLMEEYKGDKTRQQFWAYLKNGYEYFEKNHKLLPVMYTPQGDYAN